MSRKELPRNHGRQRIERESSSERRIEKVPSAIPAFVGYTRTAEDADGNNLLNVPVLVTSLADYEEKFGVGPDFRYSLEPAQSGKVDFELTGKKFHWVPSHQTSYEIPTLFYLYSSLKFFFANGGGKCYIVSVGQFETYTLKEGVLGMVPQKDLTTPNAETLISGLTALAGDLKPAPTIVLVPDAQLLSREECYRVQQETLLHCGVLADRIALFDIWGAHDETRGMEDVEAFREGIGADHLEYGVSYYPWVQTLLYTSDSVSYFNMMNAASLLPELFPGRKALGELKKLVSDLKALKMYLRVPPVDRKGNAWISWARMFMENPNEETAVRSGPAWRVSVLLKMWDMLLDLGIERKFPTGNAKIANDDIIGYVFTLISPGGPLAYYLGQIYLHDHEFPEGPVGVMTNEVLGKYDIQPPQSDGGTYPVVDTEDARGRMEAFLIMIFQIFSQAVESVIDKAHELLLAKDNAFAASNPNYKRLMQSLADAANILPVTPGLAGLFVENDAGKGVWNAPTNIPMKAVAATCISIDNKGQDKLNRDPNAGKSVNAIRSFFGKGAATVYGARTLAGNDPDFRYLPDKRTVMYIEQSIANTLPGLASMPNNEETWGELKRILKRFLKRIWRSRGLQGDSKEEAYQIEVGVGETMSTKDLQDGVMKLTVKVAPAVPEEFIEMKFEQKMTPVG